MAPEPVPATLPLVVVAHDDPATADSLRHAVETAAGFRVAVAQPGRAGLAAALATGPAVALVGCALLADLPAGCGIPLLAVGDDDRPADLRAALQAGATGMLAWPDGAADLPGELARAVSAGQPQAPGGGALVVAARGVHGGAGTTTVAVHLAAAWARWGSAPVLLVDLAGGLGFRLDLGGAPSWSALAGDGRIAAIDGASLAAAVAEPWTGLAVLPLAGLADGTPEPTPEPWAVQGLLEAARSAYRLVVCDLPAADGPAVHAALAQADALLAVGRCETAGIRGLQAALAAWTAAGRDPDAAGGVVTGVRPQAPLAPREVRAVLGDRLWGLIPAAAPELAAAAEDGALLLDRHDLPAVQAMLTLANRVVPFAAVSA
ncbi:MAG TPA: cellulose synthase operon protein YhjQ/BcsQ [Actinomycetota bacterium]|nr:cellulose synthase operon protein YhjQ/BcsQ [Actinomycetota bacterium]